MSAKHSEEKAENIRKAREHYENRKNNRPKQKWNGKSRLFKDNVPDIDVNRVIWER